MSSAFQSAGAITIAGATVPRIGLGTNRLSGSGMWGPSADRRQAVELLRDAYDMGLRLFDTAESYGPYFTEELVGEVLGATDAVIATKGGMLRPGPGQWQPDGRPTQLRAACHGSLRRLRRPELDVFQLHAPDPLVPFEESVGALADFRREGKIRNVGLCNVSAAELRAARAIVPIASVQNRFNLLDRSSAEVLQICASAGIPLLAWHPVGAGALSATDDPTVSDIARRHDATPAQVALAWLLHRSTNIVPIPGTTRTAHLAENFGALSVALTRRDIGDLDALESEKYEAPFEARISLTSVA